MNAAKAEEEVERIMKTCDSNRSGSIDYTGINIFFKPFMKIGIPKQKFKLKH